MLYTIELAYRLCINSLCCRKVLNKICTVILYAIVLFCFLFFSNEAWCLQMAINNISPKRRCLLMDRHLRVSNGVLVVVVMMLIALLTEWQAATTKIVLVQIYSLYILLSLMQEMCWKWIYFMAIRLTNGQLVTHWNVSAKMNLHCTAKVWRFHQGIFISTHSQW